MSCPATGRDSKDVKVSLLIRTGLLHLHSFELEPLVTIDACWKPKVIQLDFGVCIPSIQHMRPEV